MGDVLIKKFKMTCIVLACLFVFLPINAYGAAKPMVINPVDLGADSKGKRDSTKAFREAVDKVAPGGKIVVPAGVFLIDVAKGINLKSNISLQMSPKTVLKAIPSNLEGYSILKVFNAVNITISGGTLVGDRSTHLGKKGEWGFGILIKGGKNIDVAGVNAKDFWGDGFYIDQFNEKTGSENIRLQNCSASNNRRQGLSICQGKNITISGSSFNNTKGTIPQSGIDIEPYQNRVVENVQITNSSFINNSGCGVLVYGAGSGIARNISIQNINSRGNKENGIWLINTQRSAVAKSQIIGNGLNGISLKGSASNKIVGNTISQNGRYGIRLYKSNSNFIYGNNFYRNRYKGLVLLSSRNNQIVKNRATISKLSDLKNNLLVNKPLTTIGITHH